MKNFFEKRLIFLSVCLIFFIINTSSISLNYGFSDDYFYLYNYSIQNISDFRKLFFGLGRPVLGILFEFFFSNISTIADLRLLRIFSFTGVLILLFIINEFLNKINLKKIEHFFLLTFLFTIPSISIIVSWSTLFTVPLGLIFSISSALIIYKNISNNYLRIHFFVNCFLGIVLLLISSFIYQPASMYYWVIVGIILLLLGENQMGISNHKIFLVFIIVWVITMFLSFIFILTNQNIYSGQEMSRTVLAISFFDKLSWFVYEVILRSLNFHLLSNNTLLPIIFLIIIIFGFYIYFEDQKIKKIKGYFLITILLILSYFPNLIIEENWASYRTQISISSLFVVFIFVGLRSIFQKFVILNKSYFYTFILIALSFCSIILYSHNQIKYLTYPQSLEIGFFRFQLTDYDNKVFDEIYIIQPIRYGSLPIGSFGYDEFGIPSSSQYWAPDPMARLLLREMNLEYKDLKITVLPPETKKAFTNSDFVLDLRKLREFKSPDKVNNYK